MVWVMVASLGLARFDSRRHRCGLCAEVVDRLRQLVVRVDDRVESRLGGQESFPNFGGDEYDLRGRASEFVGELLVDPFYSFQYGSLTSDGDRDCRLLWFMPSGEQFTRSVSVPTLADGARCE